MVCIVKTVAFSGIEARLTEVQVSISSGLPAFVIVGLPDKAVNESRERVRAVFLALGIDFPNEHITVNLTPPDLAKEGAYFDLPIAIALLGAMKVISPEALKNFIFMGALGLDGSLERVNGILPAAIKATAEHLGFVCPASNGVEAAWSDCANILAPHHLLELLNYFKGKAMLAPPKRQTMLEQQYPYDLADVKGQESAKRALLIAAAGGHNMLMIGPPGAGKTMLAERLNTIMPALSVKEALETAMIHSVAGIWQNGLSLCRPFRAPHHSASLPALIGGGRKGIPGEVSLAHNGILFLDELPEFNRATIDALRQPLESKKAVIARVMAHTEYPADFQLIGAMNPCRCGKLGTKGHSCPRAPQCAIEYMNKLSGPFLDRIDIQIEVSAVKLDELTSESVGTTSAQLREKVKNAREIACERLDKMGVKGLNSNANLKGEILEKSVELDTSLRQFTAYAAEKLGLTARGTMRILRLARTIADLQNEKKVSKIHITEALSYRTRFLGNTY